MGMATSLLEFMNYLDNAPRHVVSLLGCSCAGPGVGLSIPHESLPTQDIPTQTILWVHGSQHSVKLKSSSWLAVKELRLSVILPKI